MGESQKYGWRSTYKNPIKVLSVDIEAEVNAGHAVDPESDMHFCAIAPGVDTSTESKTALFLILPLLGIFAYRAVGGRCPIRITGPRRVLDGFMQKSTQEQRQGNVDVCARPFPSVSSAIFRRGLDYRLI